MNGPGPIRRKMPGGWVTLCLAVTAAVLSADSSSPTPPARRPRPEEVLSPRQWEQVDRSVDRALRWLAVNQLNGGSFRSIAPGQPGVTALCVMAFLAGGHRPGEGPYGRSINAGIDFVLACQKPNGLICYRVPGPRLTPYGAAHTSLYNHGIAGVLLGEVYGMTDQARAKRIRVAIDRAMQFTRAYQVKRKTHAVDRGGWRYYHSYDGNDSDLSMTAWHLMFLRSAKNAGFHVPGEYVDQTLEYVRRCFSERQGTFRYAIVTRQHVSRAVAGCGILSLSLGGRHDTKMARKAGDWLLRHPFGRYNVKSDERYHYALYYCTQAMFQLGGRYWSAFFPPVARTLLANQGSNGSWRPESAGEDARFGNAYTTAMVVLSLTTPYQLLPIYQR